MSLLSIACRSPTASPVEPRRARIGHSAGQDALDADKRLFGLANVAAPVFQTVETTVDPFVVPRISPIAIGLSLRRFQYTQAIFSDKADCCHGRIVLKINSERLAVFGIVRRPRPL